MNSPHETRKILAICTGHRCRSRTLHAMGDATPGIECRSAGTHPVEGGREILEEDLKWCDLLVVFEDFHVRTIQSRFWKLAKRLRIINLDVPDQFAPLDRRLIPILQALCKQRLNLTLNRPSEEQIEAAERKERETWQASWGITV